MNETCMKHALNMPDLGGCPYCQIAALTAERDRYKAALERITAGGFADPYDMGDIAKRALEG